MEQPSLTNVSSAPGKTLPPLGRATPRDACLVGGADRGGVDPLDRNRARDTRLTPLRAISPSGASPPGDARRKTRQHGEAIGRCPH